MMSRICFFLCLFLVFEEMLCKTTQCNQKVVDIVDEAFASHTLSFLDDLHAKNGTRSFTLNLCGEKKNDGDAAVLQLTSEGQSTIVGQLGDVGVLKGPNWALLVFGGGAKYENDAECKGLNRSAHILINCDITQERKVSSVQELKSKSACFHLFTIESKHVCSGGSSSGGMSFFGIFFLLLLIIIVLYFAIGVLYKRIAHDARGWEQLPNSEFWMGISERCVSALDRIRYGDRFSSERYNNIETTTPAFDQEENDDRLLTM